MDVDVFQHFYNYHFSENRKIWDQYITSLSLDQFNQTINYSHGSVRNQIVHLMNTDEAWFSELRGVEFPESYKLVDLDNRNDIRARWDSIEEDMHGYQAGLQDSMLFEKPLPGEDKVLSVWQVLLHVVNHGTDHRAQILRVLNDLGVKTGPQDYIFYIFDNL